MLSCISVTPGCQARFSRSIFLISMSPSPFCRLLFQNIPYTAVPFFQFVPPVLCVHLFKIAQIQHTGQNGRQPFRFLFIVRFAREDVDVRVVVHCVGVFVRYCRKDVPAPAPRLVCTLFPVFYRAVLFVLLFVPAVFSIMRLFSSFFSPLNAYLRYASRICAISVLFFMASPLFWLEKSTLTRECFQFCFEIHNINFTVYILHHLTVSACYNHYPKIRFTSSPLRL